jgi:aerobic carbon-monoxide dehydrogenase small subunit
MRGLAGRRWSSEFKEPALASMVARALEIVFMQRDDAGSALPFGAVPSGRTPSGMPHGHHGEGSHPAGRGAPSLEVRSPEGELANPPGGTPIRLRFTLNGQPVSVDAPANITLLALLRDVLDLTGTKEGCGVGECGACSVLLDGRLVNSCLTLAAQANEREVTTIEGIRGPDGGPNDLQQAFIDQGAVQCGFCIPGMVLAGEALLAANAQPTRAEIRRAIAGNLCRCTGYQQIVDAIETTARKRKA